MKKQKIPLDNETPKWFRHWHEIIFTPWANAVDDRTKRNERWIYIIITAIIASGVMANGNTEQIASIIRVFFG